MNRVSDIYCNYNYFSFIFLIDISTNTYQLFMSCFIPIYYHKDKKTPPKCTNNVWGGIYLMSPLYTRTLQLLVIVVHYVKTEVLYIVMITNTTWFISPIFILNTLYLVSTIEFMYSTKIGNNTEEAPFGIPEMSTELEKKLRVEMIVEGEIFFCWKPTGTIVNKLIQYSNQSVLAW